MSESQSASELNDWRVCHKSRNKSKSKIGGSRGNLKKSSSVKNPAKKVSSFKKAGSNSRLAKKPSAPTKKSKDNLKKNSKYNSVREVSRSRKDEEEGCCPCLGSGTQEKGKRAKAVKSARGRSSPVSHRGKQGVKPKEKFSPSVDIKKPALRKISSKKMNKPSLQVQETLSISRPVKQSLEVPVEKFPPPSPPELPRDDDVDKRNTEPDLIDTTISINKETDESVHEQKKLGQTPSKLQSSQDDLPVTPDRFTSEEKNVEQMRADKEMDNLTPVEPKTEISIHSDIHKKRTEEREFSEPLKENTNSLKPVDSTKENNTNYSKKKYRRDLIPFFLKGNYGSVKPLFELNDLWFRSVDDSKDYINTTTIAVEQAEKGIFETLDENDELTKLFIEKISLSKELSDKEFKLNTELENKRELRLHFAKINSLTSDGNYKQISTIFDSLLKGPRTISKTSQLSTKWTKEQALNSASVLFQKITKKTEEKEIKQEKEQEKEQSKIKTNTSISTNNEETKESAWQLAKRYDFSSDPNFEEKRRNNRDKFLKLLEEHTLYKGPTRGSYQMPIIDFPLSVPALNNNVLGDNQLRDLYLSHWRKLVPNCEPNFSAIPKLKFINPSFITLVKSKQTENIVLLGVGKKSIVVAGYMQDSGNSTSEILMESSWNLQVEGRLNNYSGRPTVINNCNATGQLAVAIKIYKASSNDATAVNLVKEAVMMNYANRNVKFGGPQFMGLVNLSSNKEFLPIGIVSILNGDPETFEVVTLDRLLWQEVCSRLENPPKQILENIRWMKLLLNLTKLLHKYHRRLIVLNKLRMNSIVLRYIDGKGWTNPKPTNLSEATLLKGYSKCLNYQLTTISKVKSNGAGDTLATENRSFSADITALGNIIRDVNLALNLGLEGIVEYIQSDTPTRDYWSTCDVIEALEGAMRERQLEMKKKAEEAQVAPSVGVEKLKNLFRTSIQQPLEEKTSKAYATIGTKYTSNSSISGDFCFKCCRR
ncbi:DgyrCDS12188 [Dimorphilus gyrociliatus]|uniref:DgyrCDS12188 n=1 Tax=Dimorphilus gyrociliatus TaxID=2664684 RepID=A0A7I8W8H9_9ANNE|nr:DgyrCDS12188 [Dimorphilus gyrociliatus]